MRWKHCRYKTGLLNSLPQGYDIEFRQVDFAYEQGKQILNNLSFIARQGEKTALVGPSCVARVRQLQVGGTFLGYPVGKITLGGQDISRIDPKTLLKTIPLSS